MKRDAERAVAESGLPWTTLRAAQFHDLTLTIVSKLAKLPVVPIPGGLRFQPVDASEVAERIVALTGGGAAGLVTDLAGPEILPLGELVRGYLAATARRRLTVPVRLPGRAGRAYRAGANLNQQAEQGLRTWEEFLNDRVVPATVMQLSPR